MATPEDTEMMGMHPILLLVTSDSCPGCKAFVPKWEGSIYPSLITKMPDVTIGWLDMDGRKAVPRVKFSDSKDEVKIPSDIYRYLAWVPTFLLIKRSTWDSEKVTAVVYNSQENPLKLKDPKDRTPIDAENILLWVREKSILPPILEGSDCILSPCAHK